MQMHRFEKAESAVSGRWAFFVRAGKFDLPSQYFLYREVKL